MDPRLPILAGALAFLAFALLVLLITLVRARRASRLAAAERHQYDSVRGTGRDRELFSPATGGMAAVLSQPLRTGAWHPEETLAASGPGLPSSGDYWDNLINEPALLVREPSGNIAASGRPSVETEEIWLKELVADLDAEAAPAPPTVQEQPRPIVTASPVYEFTPEAVVPEPAPTPAPVIVPEPDPVPEPIIVPEPAPTPAPEPIIAPEPAPAPAPEPIIAPEPAPMPEPEPIIAPEPEPAPAPEPIIAPEPAPTPAPLIVPPAAPVVPSTPTTPRPDRPRVNVPSQPVPPAQQERPRVGTPIREPEVRPAVVVRGPEAASSDTASEMPDASPKLPIAAAPAGSDARSKIPEHVLVAPVEMWFGDHRVGVKAGSKTYDQFQRMAQVLFDDLKQSKAARK
ncbi:MAG: hypothetical protein CVT60_06815 [Actinobacteria bacterium HGW-Actinobacteria-10]|nr:MAG: hypothetical protein CVT60_06815 [Actinobacteria bacterium HGW-Actinobacteria-10]